MNVNIEIGEREPSIAEFDEEILGALSSDPRLRESIQQAFKLKARVPDVWRYVFQETTALRRPATTSDKLPNRIDRRLLLRRDLFSLHVYGGA